MSPADHANLANVKRVANMKAARRAQLKAEAVKAKAEEESRQAHELMQLHAAVADCLSQLQATWLAPLRDHDAPVHEWTDSETREKYRAVPFAVPGHYTIYLVMKLITSGSAGYWTPCVADDLTWRAVDANGGCHYYGDLADALIHAEAGDADGSPIPF